MTKKETDKVLEIVDRCFHAYASDYRKDAQEQAKQMLAETIPERHISLADHREAMHMAAVGYVRELAAVKQERDTLNWDRAQLTNRAVHAERELAEARRQVAVLSAACSSHALIGTNMAGTASEWREWAAQQAKEGGK
jgi:hypothetical protein